MCFGDGGVKEGLVDNVWAAWADCSTQRTDTLRVCACASAAFHQERHQNHAFCLCLCFIRVCFEHAPLPLQLDLIRLSTSCQRNQELLNKLGTSGKVCVFRGDESGSLVCPRNYQITALTWLTTYNCRRRSFWQHFLGVQGRHQRRPSSKNRAI